MIDPRYAHVLVVEDRDDAFYIVQDLLMHDIGVRSCARCRDGRALIECLDAPATGLIDLLLYNIKRPLRDDFALVPTLRLHPKMITGRIIALTANIMLDDVERTREADFDGFIGIPIDQERFCAQIRRILNDEFVWEPR
jgi:two-component system cell cycle response regulator DivK